MGNKKMHSHKKKHSHKKRHSHKKTRKILKFKKDNSIICEVHDETQVKFRDKVTSLSNSADIILKIGGILDTLM